MHQTDIFQLLGHTIAETFRVDQVVAEGGFGLVYKAYHLHFRAPVALKCLKIPGQLSDAERGDFLEQFRSEAEIMFRLSTRLANIVRPLHVDTIDSKQGDFIPLMALEWLDGKTFEEIIEERACADEEPMGLSEVIELLTPVAYALDQAHRFEGEDGVMAIVHRDIKPDNLFLTHLGQERIVKILDFGISKVRRAATQLAGHYSQNEVSAPFSPAYGAPEQWVPKRYGQTGPWTDVWGFALTICEIIKGDAVVVGDHQAMLGTVLDPKVRPTPRNEGVSISDAVENVFLKALAVDPRYRYQTIRGFWESLTAAYHLDEHRTPPPKLEKYAPMSASTSGGSLPQMRQPTPWNAPELRQELQNEREQGLPTMLSPAPLTRTTDAQPVGLNESELTNLFPHGPSSGNLDDTQRTEAQPRSLSPSSRKEPLKIHRWLTKPPQVQSAGSDSLTSDQEEQEALYSSPTSHQRADLEAGHEKASGKYLRKTTPRESHHNGKSPISPTKPDLAAEKKKR